jgi:hypothetical protein
MTSTGFKLEPIPDETIFGLVIQVGVLKGAKTYADCLRLVFGNKSKGWLDPNEASPERLGELLQYVNVANTQLLLKDHSAWPYWTAFQNTSMSDVLKIGGEEGNPLGALGLIGTQAIKETKVAKYCKACATEQLQKYTRMTWLRSHQLPGVMVCYKHGLSLLESNLWFDNRNKHGQEINFPQAEDALSDVGCENDLFEAWCIDQPSHMWAQMSRDCLISSGRFSNKQLVLALYNGRLHMQGLLSSGGYDWDSIENLFRERYGDLFPMKIGVDLFASKSRHWVKKLISGKEYFRQPARHLLLIGTLFDRLPNVSEVEGAGVSINLLPQRQDQAPYVPVKLRQRDHLEMREKVMKALAENSSLTRLGLREKLGRWGYQWLLRNDGDWLDTKIVKRTNIQSFEIADWNNRNAKIVDIVSGFAPEQKCQLFSGGKLNILELARQAKMSSGIIYAIVARTNIKTQLAEICAVV